MEEKMTVCDAVLMFPKVKILTICECGGDLLIQINNAKDVTYALYGKLLGQQVKSLTWEDGELKITIRGWLMRPELDDDRLESK